MKTAVYSGSFNPLHKGHIAILEWLDSYPGVEQILLVVSPKNPLKDSIDEDSAAQRFAAAKKAVVARSTSLSKVRVDDIEMRMSPPHYTIRTLDCLRKESPEKDFVLVVGADNLATFHLWKDYARILLEYGLMVYPRSGYDAEADRSRLLAENGAYRIEIMTGMNVDISSTMIREAEAEGRDMSEYRAE